MPKTSIATNTPGVASDLRKAFSDALPDLPNTYPFTMFEAGVKHALRPLQRAPSPAPEQQTETAMIDAAMVEMANITPPLRRSECARLIRAAMAAQQAAPAPASKQGGAEA